LFFASFTGGEPIGGFLSSWVGWVGWVGWFGWVGWVSLSWLHLAELTVLSELIRPFRMFFQGLAYGSYSAYLPILRRTGLFVEIAAPETVGTENRQLSTV